MAPIIDLWACAATRTFGRGVVAMGGIGNEHHSTISLLRLLEYFKSGFIQGRLLYHCS